MMSDERQLFFRRWSSAFPAFLVVLFAAYVQAGHIFSLGGVNPDSAQVALLIFSFFERNVYVILAAVLLAVFFLALPFFWIETGLVFLAFAIVAVARMFWWRRELVTVLVSVTLATILSSALLSRLSLLQNLGNLFVEIVLNCILGALIFFFFTMLKARDSKR